MADRLTLQERVEETPAGRTVISAALLFILLVFVSSNIPDSRIRFDLERLVRPVRDSAGLDQNWSVFAPNPRRETWGIRGDILYDDGSTATWVIPDGDAFIGEYRFYRWKKYAEGMFQKDRRLAWPHLALWLVRIADRPDRHPVRVQLTKHWFVLNPPGSKITRGEDHEELFYVLPVTARVLRAARKT